MNARQLVYDTLEFNGPRRVPRDLWLLPWATHHHPGKVRQIQQKYPGDFGGPPVQYVKPIQTIGDPYEIGTYTDESML